MRLFAAAGGQGTPSFNMTPMARVGATIIRNQRGKTDGGTYVRGKPTSAAMVCPQKIDRGWEAGAPGNPYCSIVIAAKGPKMRKYSLSERTRTESFGET